MDWAAGCVVHRAQSGMGGGACLFITEQLRDVYTRINMA